MNWINAKDRLPEDMENCLVYTPFNKRYHCMVFWKEIEGGLTPAHFSLLLCDDCETEMMLELDEHEIFWMPISDIPKPPVDN